MFISRYLGIILSVFLIVTILPLKAMISDDDDGSWEPAPSSKRSGKKKHITKPRVLTDSSSEEEEKFKKNNPKNNKPVSSISKKEESFDDDNDEDKNKSIFIPQLDKKALDEFKQGFLANAKTLAEKFDKSEIPQEAMPGVGLTPSRVLLALSVLLMDESECAAVFMPKKEEHLYIGVNKSKTSVNSILKSLKKLINSNDLINSDGEVSRKNLIKNDDALNVLGFSASKDRAAKKEVKAAIAKNADRMSHWLKKIIKLRNHRSEESDLGRITGCLLNGNFTLLPATGHHAEMNVLDILYDKGCLKEGGYLAISKTCCRFCAAALQAVNDSCNMEEAYQANGSHLNMYAYWKVPNFIKNEPHILKVFLGKDAFRIYEKNKVYKEEFIDAIQSQENEKVSRETRQTATETDSLTLLEDTSDESAPAIKKGSTTTKIKAVDRDSKEEKVGKKKKKKSKT